MDGEGQKWPPPDNSIRVLLRLALWPNALHCTVVYLLFVAGKRSVSQSGSRSAMRRWSKSYSTRQWQNARSGSWILRAKVVEMMTRKGVHCSYSASNSVSR